MSSLSSPYRPRSRKTSRLSGCLSAPFSSTARSLISMSKVRKWILIPIIIFGILSWFFIWETTFNDNQFLKKLSNQNGNQNGNGENIEKINNEDLNKKFKKATSRYFFPNIADILIIKSNPDGLIPLNSKQLEDFESLTNENKEIPPILKALNEYFEMSESIYLNSKPSIVLVTGLNYDIYEPLHLQQIIQNRVDYARTQGYGVYIKYLQEYLPNLKDTIKPIQWSKLLLMRDALTAFPNAKYFWYLDENSVIMRTDIDLYDYLLSSTSLNSLMLKDIPIIPPNGAIKTYKNSIVDELKFLITQDLNGLDTSSFIIINSPYSKALLEIWVDPLYRKFSKFSEAEGSALEHLLQWHPVLLSKTALIPPRTIASRRPKNIDKLKGDPNDNSLIDDKFEYHLGDLVVSLKDCEEQGPQICALWFQSYYKELHSDDEK